MSSRTSTRYSRAKRAASRTRTRTSKRPNFFMAVNLYALQNQLRPERALEQVNRLSKEYIDKLTYQAICLSEMLQGPDYNTPTVSGGGGCGMIGASTKDCTKIIKKYGDAYGISMPDQPTASTNSDEAKRKLEEYKRAVKDAGRKVKSKLSENDPSAFAQFMLAMNSNGNSSDSDSD